MDRDDSNNDGEEDETPEEMVNRSLAEAYDNQQRYMELFQHSAQMLQVLSRFMSDPIVVHDLEVIDSSDDDDDSSDTSTNTTASPDSSTLAHPSLSTNTKSPEITLEPIVAYGITVDPRTMTAQVTQGSPYARRRPQTCRWRQNMLQNGMGNSGMRRYPDDPQSQHLFGGVFNQSESMGDNIRSIRERVVEQEAAAAVAAAVAVAATVSAEETENNSSKTTTATPNTFRRNTSTASCSTYRLGQNIHRNAPAIDGSGEGIMSLRDLNKPLNASGLRSMIEAEVRKSNTACSSAASVSCQTRITTQPQQTPTSTEELRNRNSSTTTTTIDHSTPTTTMSDSRASRFAVGLATQANIKNAMSEISKAADTIRHARSMLSSMNLSTQMNNNNHESATPEKEREETENTDEASTSYRCPGAQRNIMKFVQPVEHNFGESEDSSISMSQREYTFRSSPRAILVKPAPDSKPLIITKPTSHPNTNNTLNIAAGDGQGINNQLQTTSTQNNKTLLVSGIGGNTYTSSNIIHIPQQLTNPLDKTNSDHASPSVSEAAQSDDKSSDIRETPIHTSPVAQHDAPAQDQSQLFQHQVQKLIQRKFGNHSMAASNVTVSVDMFQKALNQAIQNLEKEGVWSVGNSTSNIPDDSKIDKNNFVFPKISNLNSPPPKDIHCQVSHNEITNAKSPVETQKQEGGTEVVELRPLHSGLSPCEIRSDICEYQSGESTESISEIQFDRYAARKSTSMRCCNVSLTPVQPFSDSDNTDNEVQAIFSQDDECSQDDDDNDEDATLRGIPSQQDTLETVSDEIQNGAEDDDGIETMVLNQTTPTKHEEGKVENSADVKKSSLPPTRSPGSECWTSDKQTDQKNAVNKSQHKTSALGTTKGERIGTGSENVMDSGDGAGDTINSKVKKVTEENSSGEREVPNQDKPKGVFRRMSSTIRGWFKKKS